MAYERTDTLREQVLVAAHDTLVETTTITIDRNEVGDTLKVVQVTDRTRAASRNRVRDVKEKVIVKTDTVFVERRDSVYVEIPGQARNDGARTSPVTSALKWVFWIIIALIGLVIIIKIRR